ncbi:MAG: FkbM family methyltransferase [Methanosarcinales archaeon]|nr:FkbM family methyltransferase [Methanosarcinales archaeon]
MNIHNFLFNLIKSFKNMRIGHIYKILTNKLNRGKRLNLLYNYFSWYLYHLPAEHTYQITLSNGMKSIVHPDSDSGVSNIYSKNVDFYELSFIRTVIKKRDFMIDAGCNVGNRTLALADIIDKALLIDANEICIERLKNNFRLNNLNLSKFHFVCKAVGNERKKVQFTDFGGTSCMNKIIDSQTEKCSIKPIQMTTLDYEMEKIGNPSCAFIKTDLEGFDMDALVGTTKTLQKNNVKLVMFERWQITPLKPHIDFFNDLNWIVFALDSNGQPTISRQFIESQANLFAMPENTAPEFH